MILIVCIVLCGLESSTLFFFLMIRRPPRSTLDRSSAASDVYKRQGDGSFDFPGFDLSQCLFALAAGHGFDALFGDFAGRLGQSGNCLLYTSPSPRDRTRSRMPSSA